MVCGKCGGTAFLEEEKTLRGSVWSPHCVACGWYGPVVIDERKRKGDFVMAKRGTCTNPECKREDVQLVAKGLCWSCYAKQRGPIEPKDCKNHSVVTHPEIPKQPNPVTVKELKQQLESFSNTIQDNQILLTFEMRDFELLKLLKKNAETNRRTVENEIMFLLDNTLTVIEGI